MSWSTFFIQECPVCGRKLQVRVEYLGKELFCQHCRGRLVAGESPGPVPPEKTALAEEMLRRSQRLLDVFPHEPRGVF